MKKSKSKFLNFAKKYPLFKNFYYFYGDITGNLENNLPANSINKFLLDKKDKVKIVCVNNSQIFLQKISN